MLYIQDLKPEIQFQTILSLSHRVFLLFLISLSIKTISAYSNYCWPPFWPLNIAIILFELQATDDQPFFDQKPHWSRRMIVFFHLSSSFDSHNYLSPSSKWASPSFGRCFLDPSTVVQPLYRLIPPLPCSTKEKWASPSPSSCMQGHCWPSPPP